MHDDLTEGDINLTPARRALRMTKRRATADLLNQDEELFFHQCLSTPCLDSLQGVQGSELITGDGSRILDFHGNNAHTVGYGNQHVKAAVRQALDELPFTPRRFTNRYTVDLAQRLIAFAPPPRRRVLFAPGGATAVSIALRMARLVTGRHKTVAMEGAFHGATLDTSFVGGEDLFRLGIGCGLPGTFHVPPPHEPCSLQKMRVIFEREKDIGAVIAEPIRCTTVHLPRPGYWRTVRDLCDEFGALLIFDEIPTCLGRTGKFWACEHTGVTPDIIIIGKGLGGGVMPLAAVIARADFNRAVSSKAVGHFTHEKNPVACAAALATLDVIEQNNLVERAQRLGKNFLEQLCGLQQRVQCIREVRGAGLLLAVEVDSPALAERLMLECLQRGLNFKISSGTVLTLTPPLTVSEAELACALLILTEVLTNKQNAASALSVF